MKMFYYSSVEGRPVKRPGTDSFIGTKYKRVDNKVVGFEYETDRVVPIPEPEHTRYIRDYNNAIRRRELIERTQQDYDDYLAAREQQVCDEASQNKATSKKVDETSAEGSEERTTKPEKPSVKTKGSRSGTRKGG